MLVRVCTRIERKKGRVGGEGYVHDVEIEPPDPMHDVKLSVGKLPHEMPLCSWYLSGIKYFHPTILVGRK